jgi:hypothetical protein
MSVIKTGTTSTTGYVVESDTNGNLVIQTGSTPTTALTLNSNQTASFAQSVNLPNTFGFKNRIINGGMVIDQRNAGASVTPADNAYTLDRWQSRLSQASKYSVQQSSTAPAGFVNSLLVTSLSAYTVGASEFFQIRQIIEGFNISDLGFGSATAQSVTLSFWVRSSLTGTFGGVLSNSDGSRSYVFSYTISAANTFEQKTIVIPGDTTGTWLTTSGGGFVVAWSLGAGATVSTAASAWNGSIFRGVTGGVSVVGTNGATFYITGVQLERGSAATSFDFRSYGTELALCQRYYYKEQANTIGNLFASGFCDSTTTTTNFFIFPVIMRANPTALEQSGTASDYSVLNSSGSSIACSIVPAFSNATTKSARFIATVASGLSGGNGTYVRAASTNAYLGWSAEL